MVTMRTTLPRSPLTPERLNPDRARLCTHAPMLRYQVEYSK